MAEILYDTVASSDVKVNKMRNFLFGFRLVFRQKSAIESEKYSVGDARVERVGKEMMSPRKMCSHFSSVTTTLRGRKRFLSETLKEFLRTKLYNRNVMFTFRKNSKKTIKNQKEKIFL